VTTGQDAGQDPHQLHPDHLPTPFTADEIRVACQPGRTLRFRIERAGEEPVIRISRYVSADPDGAVQESWAETLEGVHLSEPGSERSTWLELQEHASFPTGTTTLAEKELSIPAGQFDCLCYTRLESDSTWRFWFARDLPGQPIRFERQVGDAVVFSATLLENVPAG
jgi:hypothetical protein